MYNNCNFNTNANLCPEVTLTMTVNAYARTSSGNASELLTYTIVVEVGANFDVNKVLNKTMTGGVYKVEGSSNYYALSINDLKFN